MLAQHTQQTQASKFAIAIVTCVELPSGEFSPHGLLIYVIIFMTACRVFKTTELCREKALKIFSLLFRQL